MSAPGQRAVTVLTVATPAGPGRWHVDLAEEPRGTLLLGHGAGGGVGARDLDLLARKLPVNGVSVLRFEQPWRVAGRRVATPPPHLDLAWRAAVDALLADGLLGGRLVFGGRSAGARVACRTADAYVQLPTANVVGVVCLAFPLHLPGRPAQSRASELLAPTVPRLVLQGTGDAFGSADEVRAAAAGADVRVIDLPGGDHSFRGVAVAQITDPVGAFVDELFG